MDMKTIIVTTTFRGEHEIEVPNDWEYDGLKSLVEYDDLSAADASVELIDWEWREAGSR